jgi:hypothetical protein
MALLRRPAARFSGWAILLVVVAVATSVAGLASWLIALVELAAWAAVTLVERSIWRRSVGSPARAELKAVPVPKPTAPPQAVHPLAAAPAPEPVAAPIAAPTAETGRRRVIRTPVRAAASEATVASAPRELVRWNVWSLERLARDHPNAEELEYLVVSLREFADSHGELPPDFDPLVRDSFGDVLLG